MEYSTPLWLDKEETAQSLANLAKYDPSDVDSLFTGNLGKVISLLNLAEYYSDKSYIEKSVVYLKRITDRIGEKNGLKFTTALSNGLSGLGFSMIMLEKGSFSSEDCHFPNLLKWIARKVYQKAKIEIDEWDLDAVHSSIGGVYFLSKYQRLYPQSFDYVSELVDILFDKIEDDYLGKYLANKRYRNNGEYYIQLGIAHGVCGIALTLVEVYRSNKNMKARQMIEICLEFLKNYFKPYEKREEFFLFPRAVTTNGVPKLHEKTRANIGWCSSDLSITYTFLLAGYVLEDKLFSNFGNRLLSDFLKFRNETLPIIDSNLCHGYAGFSLLYRKCHELTHREDCLVASRLWMQKAIDSVKNEKGESFWFGKQGAYIVILSDKFNNTLPWHEILFLK